MGKRAPCGSPSHPHLTRILLNSVGRVALKANRPGFKSSSAIYQLCDPGQDNNFCVSVSSSIKWAQNVYLIELSEVEMPGPISSAHCPAHNLNAHSSVPISHCPSPVTWAGGPLLSILAGADVGSDADAAPTAEGAEG